jgi:hypothetical protein
MNDRVRMDLPEQESADLVLSLGVGGMHTAVGYPAGYNCTRVHLYVGEFCIGRDA